VAPMVAGEVVAVDTVVRRVAGAAASVEREGRKGTSAARRVILAYSCQLRG